MKKILIAVVNGLASVIASAIITALITGQPLTGLFKLKGLVGIYLHGPLLTCAIAGGLFLGLLILEYSLLRSPTQVRKLHFVPDAHNCFWAQNGDGEQAQMYVSVGGTFTFEGPSPVTFLTGYFKGTRPVTDMQIAVVSNIVPERPLVQVQEFVLEPHEVVRAFLHLYLRPAIGKRSEPFKGKLILKAHSCPAIS
jgi:hypothetical protein